MRGKGGNGPGGENGDGRGQRDEVLLILTI